MNPETTILIVDDDPTNLTVLREALNETGQIILMAKSGERALYQLGYQLPDLILLDVLMPGIDGFETCRRIKQNPAAAHIPVIFMTALSDVDNKVKGFAAGGVDYIAKPFHRDEVLARVNAHLAAHRLRQQLEQSNAQLAATLAEVEKLSGLLQTVINLVPVGVYVKDTTGRKTLSNPADVHHLGAESETQVLGKTDAAFYLPAVAARFAADDRAIIQSGTSIISREEKGILLDGRARWFLSSKVPLRDSAGQITGLVGISHDITARKQAEQIEAVQLAVSQILAGAPEAAAGLRQLLAALADRLGGSLAELWWRSDEGQSLIWRDGWRASNLPRLAEFEQASRDYTFEPGHGLPGAAWQVGQAIGDKELASSPTCPRITEAAAAGFHSALGLPLLIDGETVGVMTFFSSSVEPLPERLLAALTELGRQIGQFLARKQAETDLTAERSSLVRRVAEQTAVLSQANAELTQAMRAKDAFMATMSHELRTPLHGILGMVEALQEEVYGSLTEEQRLSTRIIDQNGRHLLALVDDILNFVQIETGQMKLDLDTVLVADVCRASLRRVKEAAAQKEQRLALHLADETVSVSADPKRLQQILVNLLNNAIKFTSQGGQVSLKVWADPSLATLKFAVCDNGIGITPANQAKLFKPFSQIDNSLSRRYEGAGLGLALVKGLVDLHGGGIEVISAGIPGQGSCFTVSLPHHREGEN